MCWGETPSFAQRARAERAKRIHMQLFSAEGPPGMSYTSPASSRDTLRTGSKRLTPSLSTKATNLPLVAAVSTAYAHSGRDLLVLGPFLLKKSVDSKINSGRVRVPRQNRSSSMGKKKHLIAVVSLFVFGIVVWRVVGKVFAELNP